MSQHTRVGIVRLDAVRQLIAERERQTAECIEAHAAAVEAKGKYEQTIFGTVPLADIGDARSPVWKQVQAKLDQLDTAIAGASERVAAARRQVGLAERELHRCLQQERYRQTAIDAREAEREKRDALREKSRQRHQREREERERQQEGN
jgi:outer membrane PBP1 activator LpoA protein